jgi:hypothetical protein
MSRLTFSLSLESISLSLMSGRPGKFNKENKKYVFCFAFRNKSHIICSKLRQHLNDERNGQRYMLLPKKRRLLQLKRSESDGIQKWMATMERRGRKRRKRTLMRKIHRQWTSHTVRAPPTYKMNIHHEEQISDLSL